MIEINLRDALNERQFYVAELGEKLGIEIKAVKHEISTDTCFEKADLLGWSVNRVIKAVFFGGGGKLYGLICPELGTRDKNFYFNKHDLGEILGKTNKQIKNFHNSICPDGMERGTCTPFVPETAFEYDGFTFPLDKIFIHDSPEIDKELVDISIGGYGGEAHKVSLHLKYEDIYHILKDKFNDKVDKTNFLKIFK
jgi:hypothetical protein